MKELFRKLRYKLAYLIAPDWIDDLEYRLSTFLWYQTDGRLSKPYYSVEVMVDEAYEAAERFCESCEYRKIKEGSDESKVIIK